MVHAHPLKAVKQELVAHGQAVELPLGGLSPEAVTSYLAQRGDIAAQEREGMAALVYRRTEGHPLFMVQVVDYLVRQAPLPVVPPGGIGGAGAEGTLDLAVPQRLRDLLEAQLGRLGATEQQVLEVGSVAGAEFAAASVAAGVQMAPEAVEAVCEGLARQGQFLEDRGLAEWPDETVSGRYGFRHALYQEVVYQRLGEGRRARLHRLLGARDEAGYGARAHEVAAELARHFEQGQAYPRAVQYRQQAAENARRQHAYQEAIHHLRQGLALLQSLPESAERAKQEIELQLALGSALIAMKGYAIPEVEQTYARAQTLCQQVGDTAHLFSTLWGLCEFHRNRGALQTARELGEHLYRLAQHEATPTHRMEAHEALGVTLFLLGEYAAAWSHLEQGIVHPDVIQQRALALCYGEAPGVRCCAIAAHTLWCLGYPAQALQRSQEALGLAQALDHPYSLAMAQHWAAFLHYRRREPPAVQAQAETLLTLATMQGFPLLVGYGTCWRGLALALQSQGEAGLAQLHQGMAALVAIGQTLVQPLCLLLLSAVAGHTGQVAEGLRLLAEALAALAASGRGDLLAEAYRLQGVLLLQQAVPEPTQAEACFQHALAIARRQQAKSWELRAAISLIYRGL
jgi:predicted ATPase